ncbi:MAG: dihydrofolate reductase [Planctomycetota bacterium]
MKIDKEMTAVVAATPSGVIGRDGGMPWRLRTDLHRFKRMTMGGTLIMGRKTFESIGRPLPGRQTIVVTRNKSWKKHEGVEVAESPEQAVELSQGRCFVVGGAQIYDQLLAHCQQILFTRVFSEVKGDTHLEIPFDEFRIVEQWRIPAGSRDDVPTEFVRLIRREAKQNS